MPPARERVPTAFARVFGDPPALAVEAPGRVNLIGEHTDYNDGFVLPTTLGLTTVAAFRRRPDRTIRIHAADPDETIRLGVGEPPPSAPSWAAYAGGCAHLLDAEIGLDAGFDLTFGSDVPIGAGLSSSAALETAILFGLGRLFASGLDPMRIARLGQRVEHVYAGVRCGIMDQCAVALGRAGHALALDCRSLAAEHVPLRTGTAGFLVVDSRAPRDLASSAYNERRAACEAGVAALRAAGVAADRLRDVTPADLEAHAARLDPTVLRRCRHVVEENARVAAAVEALRAGDAAQFGALMDASHESLRTLYDVSSPPLDHLVDTARAQPGVLGARLTGAGFGGCVVMLAERASMDDLSRVLAASYAERFGRAPVAYVVAENRETTVLPHPAAPASPCGRGRR